MRSAESRLGVVDSVEGVRKGVGACVDALPVSARVLRIGGTAAAGLLGVGLVRGLLPIVRGKTPPPPAPAAPAAGSGVAGYLLTQIVVSLVLPVCRSFLTGKLGGSLLERLLAPRK